jgi:2-oxoglutarate dehydrogenase E2 component (dihydrolipoamide succinyltransferase)
MATDVKVPAMGESVTQATLLKWHKQDGETVAVDEPLAEMETDKANVDINAEVAGVVRHVSKVGDAVKVGEVIARIESGAGVAAKTASPGSSVNPSDKATGIPSPAQSSSADSAQPAAAQRNDAAVGLSPAVERIVAENRLDPASIKATGPGGRLTKEDVVNHMAAAKDAPAAASRPAPEQVQPAPKEREKPIAGKPAPVGSAPAKKVTTMDFDAKGVHREPMSKIRKRIAENLIRAQETAAILTTFNEIDMTGVFDLRAKYKDRFSEVHGIGLGLMSFFVRATVLALKEFPRVNAFIEGDEVVYHNYVHMGIAVSTERGLAVPVMRNAQDMSFARIENEIKRLAAATRDGKLGLDELSGGTFTVTNGGVFGSLLSTPIINPPQSGILGMHSIQKRPVAINDKVEIRPMMYVALSYDHRLVDGRESVSFLVRLKQLVEDPARLMLEV